MTKYGEVFKGIDVLQRLDLNHLMIYVASPVARVCPLSDVRVISLVIHSTMSAGFNTLPCFDVIENLLAILVAALDDQIVEIWLAS